MYKGNVSCHLTLLDKWIKKFEKKINDCEQKQGKKREKPTKL